MSFKINLYLCTRKRNQVGSINSHRKFNSKHGGGVLSSFRFLSVHTASPFGHIARYAPSTTDTLPSI